MGANPLSQSDPSKIGDSDRPFDGYEDVAEGAPEPHKHPVIPDTYKSGTGFRLTVLALLLTMGLGTAFFFVSGIKAQDEAQLAAATEAKMKEPAVVEVMTVTAAPPDPALRLPAEARGWYASTIYARVSGYLTKWYTDIGDRVRKDQPLAKIDTPELDAQLDAAKAQLVASEAEVKVRES